MYAGLLLCNSCSATATMFSLDMFMFEYFFYYMTHYNIAAKHCMIPHHTTLEQFRPH